MSFTYYVGYGIFGLKSGVFGTTNTLKLKDKRVSSTNWGGPSYWKITIDKYNDISIADSTNCPLVVGTDTSVSLNVYQQTNHTLYLDGSLYYTNTDRFYFKPKQGTYSSSSNPRIQPNGKVTIEIGPDLYGYKFPQTINILAFKQTSKWDKTGVNCVVESYSNSFTVTRVNDYKIEIQFPYATTLTSEKNYLLYLIMFKDSNGNEAYLEDILEEVSQTKYTVTNTASNCVLVGEGEYNEKEEVLLLLEANAGYEFTTPPSITNGDTTVTFVDEGDGTFSAEFQIKGDIVFNTNPTPVAQTTYTVTNTASNCTLVGTGEYNENATVNLLLEPNEGYEFTTPPTFTNGGSTVSFIDNLDGTFSATFQIKGNVVFNTNPTPAIQTFNITNNDIHSTLTCNKQLPVEEGTSVTLTLTPNTGYMFESAPTITDGTNTYTFTDAGNETYTLTLTVNANWNIPANQSVQYVTVSYSCLNCTCNIPNGTRYIKGSDFPTIIITPNAGFTFGTTSQLYEYNNRTYSFLVIPNQDYQRAVLPESKINHNVTFSANAMFVNDKLGFVHIYKPTKQQLSALASARLVWNGITDFNDYSEFILSLKKVYINITTQATEYVYYGGLNTNVQCGIIESDNIEVDCGSVNIAEKFNNSIDYRNTSLELYLPYIGVQPLDTSKYMGKQVYLKYNVNPITGDCVATLYEVDNATNVYLDSFAGNVSFEIPINQSTVKTINVRNGYQDNPLYLLNDVTPKIYAYNEIPMDKPLNGIPELHNGLISSFNGECQFIDCDLSPNNIPKDEFEMIMAELEKGVVV